MRYYFLIMGCLCILYYLVLAFYSRRLRSTFAAFWLISGGVHLVLGCAPLPVYVYKALGWFCLGCWILFLFIEFKIIRGMCAQCDEELDWIIVLGAQVRGRYITNSLRRRLDCALAYAQRFPRVKVIVSGGQGPGEAVSEAQAMAEYLEENEAFIREYSLEIGLYAEEGAALMMDRGAFKRILDNLLTNSIRYREKNQSRIEIRVQKKEGRIFWSVADDGPGVAENCLEKIFESFCRLDEARSHCSEGSGLGLAIVKRIVTDHQGSIYARDRVGLEICMEFSEV